MHSTTVDEAHLPCDTSPAPVLQLVCSALKCIPVTVTLFPPATGPALGFTPETTTSSKYSNSICEPIGKLFCPTRKLTVPALSLCGLLHTTDDGEMTLASATAPSSKKHFNPDTSDPCTLSATIVTRVPPSTPPELGQRLRTFTPRTTLIHARPVPTSTWLLLTITSTSVGYAMLIAHTAAPSLLRAHATQVAFAIRSEMSFVNEVPVMVTMPLPSPATIVEGCTESSSGANSYRYSTPELVNAPSIPSTSTLTSPRPCADVKQVTRVDDTPSAGPGSPLPNLQLAPSRCRFLPDTSIHSPPPMLPLLGNTPSTTPVLPA